MKQKEPQGQDHWIHTVIPLVLATMALIAAILIYHSIISPF